jgi:hypothetical protein
LIDTQLCSICKNDGKCLNNETHKDYEKNNEDVWLGTDYWDCVDYLEKQNGTIGKTMKNYVSNLQKESETQEDYESGFCKWSKHHK